MTHSCGGSPLKTIDELVGAKIRERRKTLQITQDQLGVSIGVTFQQVQKYESGVNRVSASRLHAVGKALGVKPAFFFEGLSIEEEPGDASEEVETRKDWCRLEAAFRTIKPATLRKALVSLAEAMTSDTLIER